MTYPNQQQGFLAKINKKEYLVICILLVLLLISGGYIYGKVSASVHAKAQLYLTAVQATTAEQFNYAVDSRQGNVLTRGKFSADIPLVHNELTGEYYLIKQTREEYRMHTETYPCGTTEQPRTCTRTYWSWDYVGSDSKKAMELWLHGRKYQSNMFSYSGGRRVECGEIKTECKHNYVYTSERKRHYFTVNDTSFTGTIAVNTSNGYLQPMEGNGAIPVQREGMKEIVESNQGKGVLIGFTIGYLIIAALIWIIVINYFREIDL